MASLTIRKLDEGVKACLRLRSAKNGRSLEEEIRVILRETIQGGVESVAPVRPAARPPGDALPAARARTRPIRPASP